MLTQQSFAQENIFKGGNDDGFTLSCYAQPDNIFSGGNDDGFGFSCVGALGTEVPLPVELINFIAHVQDNWVNLKWQTASEINNDYFTIEKSQNGVVWEQTKKINGAGNSSSQLSYSTVDRQPFLGVSYYRLKQTDFDGQFEYSQIRSINIELSDNSQIEIYPNPTNNKITVMGNQNELEDIIIYNTLGQDVTLLTQQIENNKIKVVIDLTKLSSGIYYIKTKTTANKLYKQ